MHHETLGGCSPQKNQKKTNKKPSQFTNFGVATGFFLVFFGLSFGQHSKLETGFWYFLVFFWDGILTIRSNAKKTKKNQKKNQKKPKKTKKNQKPVSNFECWPKLKPKKPKKTKKNQKKPVSNFEFWPKLMPKKPKKTKKNQCQFGNFKKPKKTKKNQKKNQCQFADFGVATGFFWFFFG